MVRNVGLPLGDRARYRLSRDTLARSAITVMPPCASTTWRNAIKKADSPPSSSSSSNAARRYSTAMLGSERSISITASSWFFMILFSPDNRQKRFGLSDILLLAFFAATNQQQHPAPANIGVIHSIAGAIGNTQLHHAFTNGFGIAGIAQRQSVEAGQHAHRRLNVLFLGGIEPRLKRVMAITGQVVL